MSEASKIGIALCGINHSNHDIPSSDFGQRYIDLVKTDEYWQLTFADWAVSNLFFVSRVPILSGNDQQPNEFQNNLTKDDLGKLWKVGDRKFVVAGYAGTASIPRGLPEQCGEVLVNGIVDRPVLTWWRWNDFL